MGYKVIQDLAEIPPLLHPGRPKGSGRNQKVLAQLKPGDPRSCIWGCCFKKREQFRDTAKKDGIRLKTRKIIDEHGKPKYVIWRLT